MRKFLYFVVFHYRRASSFGDEYFSDEDDFFDDYDGYVNYIRHEFCFDEFKGYGEDYEGPKGVLTSYLPDGTSVTIPRNALDNRNRSAAVTAGEGNPEFCTLFFCNSH